MRLRPCIAGLVSLCVVSCTEAAPERTPIAPTQAVEALRKAAWREGDVVMARNRLLRTIHSAPSTTPWQAICDPLGVRAVVAGVELDLALGRPTEAECADLIPAVTTELRRLHGPPQ